MLLYIHGFNSSPFSDKAVITAKYMAKHHPSLVFHQPQLPNTPKAAMALLQGYVTAARQAHEPLRFIGSSLGGYFASYLAEHYGGRAVLVNPAV
ncbi:MAG: YqiA/YcfP family alpha/beta fold hydrolase, partial [Shewanella sp.]